MATPEDQRQASTPVGLEATQGQAPTPGLQPQHRQSNPDNPSRNDGESVERAVLHAYINHPNPHITVHGQSTCGAIGKMRKPGQRQVRLHTASIGHELQWFAMKAHGFGSDTSTNDMWGEIDFGDGAFEHVKVNWARRKDSLSTANSFA